MADSPIFVMGAPRSGTTLTARILNAHPNLFFPGETHFFPDVYSRRDRYGDPPAPEHLDELVERMSTLYERFNEPKDQRRIETLFAGAQKAELRRHAVGYRELLNFFMDRQTSHAGKLRWGNHAPRNLFHVEEILGLYPAARIVACVRDPRAFLLSYRNKWRATTADNVDRIRKLYHPITTSLLWKASNRAVLRLKKQSPDTLLVLRYEDLVDDPARAVAALCEFVAEEFDPRMLEVEDANSSFGDHQPGIFKESAERWKTRLSPEEICIAQWLLKAEMTAFGYECVEVKPAISTIAKHVATFPAVLWGALRANRSHTGPLIPFLARRAATLLPRARRPKARLHSEK